MSTTLTTPAIATSTEDSTNSPVMWSKTTKGGDVIVRKAHCATSQVFAPKAARLVAAQEKDVFNLLNGGYRAVLASVADKITAKEKVSLFEAGVTVNQNAPSKKDMVPFADHVGKLWLNAKGEKKALGETLRRFAELATGAVTAA